MFVDMIDKLTKLTNHTTATAIVHCTNELPNLSHSASGPGSHDDRLIANRMVNRFFSSKSDSIWRYVAENKHSIGPVFDCDSCGADNKLVWQKSSAQCTEHATCQSSIYARQLHLDQKLTDQQCDTEQTVAA